MRKKYQLLNEVFPHRIPPNYVFKQYKPWLKIYGLDEPDKFIREKIEAQVAHNERAKYWSPAPGQLKRIMKSN